MNAPHPNLLSAPALRIAVISSSDTKSGGASRVGLDLVTALQQAGQQVTHLVGLTGKGYTETRRSLYGGPVARAFVEQAGETLQQFGLPQALPLDAPGLFRARITRDFDIAHFHDLSPGMSPLTIAALSWLMPTFWTFHDCSPFTGGCLYPMDCARYQIRCGSDGGCPQLGQWPLGKDHDFTGGLQAMRARAHRLGKITAIAPSDWLADLAMSSGKLPNRPTVITNGIDTETFQPAQNRAALRQELRLPADQPVILLSAARFEDAKKGTRHAVDAIKAVADLRPFVLVVGRPDEKLAAALESVPHHVTGFVQERAELASWYAAADLQVNCSLAEVQGLVILEAMACGVPTIGFASGGIPASITQNESGFLVPPGDMPALIAALRHALEPGIAAAWGRAARARVEQNFSYAHFIDGHLKAYRERLAA